MTRARSGKTVLRNRARLRKLTKGFRAGRHHQYRQAVVTLMRAGVYAYRDRRARKGDMRRLWIVRINAAARHYGMSYSVFMSSLKARGITLNRKVLADLAVRDAEAFGALVTAAKEALEAA